MPRRRTTSHKRCNEDQQVQILENPSALARAWIVHAAIQAEPSAALTAFVSGQVNARQTAILEEAPPLMAPAMDPFNDRATVTQDQPDYLSISTSSNARGLLMLSEVAYPAWKAYVDGQPEAVLSADGALRAVPIPAGDHLVELRFESAMLWIGTSISAVALAVLAIFALLPVYARWTSTTLRRESAI